MLGIMDFFLDGRIIVFMLGVGMGLAIMKHTENILKEYIRGIILMMIFFIFYLVLLNSEYIFRDRKELDTYKIIKAEIVSIYSVRINRTWYYAKIKFYYNDKEYNAKSVKIAFNEHEGDTIYIGVRKSKDGSGLKVIRPNIIIHRGTDGYIYFLSGYILTGCGSLIKILLDNKKGKGG